MKAELAPLEWRACVSDEYCRWIQRQPDFDGVTCRYSDGFEFENGPPDDGCADGADPTDPFCGGRCGNTCPLNPLAAYPTIDDGGCVGRSETRGFGVCVPGAYDFRCWPGVSHDVFDSCSAGLYVISGMTRMPDCVCMILPVADPEYADHGWAVAGQTCLAYQARYPDEVRCVAESEL